MTEAEWLACADPQRLLLFLRDATGERKQRLLACSFCRDMGSLIDDARYWRVVSTGERWADEGAEPCECGEVYQAATDLHDEAFAARDFDTSLTTLYALTCIESDPLFAFIKRDVSRRTGWGRVLDVGLRVLDRLFVPKIRGLKPIPDTRHWCELVRDIFGNPFRPVAFSESWRTDTAVTLARQMYDARDFTAMPILADALQDAGCDNEDVLNHCRDAKQTHVRGCWVADLVLGKQ